MLLTKKKIYNKVVNSVYSVNDGYAKVFFLLFCKERTDNSQYELKNSDNADFFLVPTNVSDWTLREAL